MPLALRIRDAAGMQLVFDASRVLIGRGSHSDLQLPDPSVCLRHASIRARGRHYVIVDEGSANGVFVGEQRLDCETPQRIASGQAFRLGRIWLEIVADTAEPPTPAAALGSLGHTLVERALLEEGKSAAEAAAGAQRRLRELVSAPTEVLPSEFREPAPAAQAAEPPAALPRGPRPRLLSLSFLRAGMAREPKAAWRRSDTWLLLLSVGVLAASALALARLLRPGS